MKNRIEQGIQIAVVDVLAWRKAAGVVFFHPPNEAKRASFKSQKTGKTVCIEGAILKRMGARSGVSDLCFSIPPNGRFAALELKAPGEKPTPNQREFIEAVAASGGLSDWADSVEKAVAILKAWGVLK